MSRPVITTERLSKTYRLGEYAGGYRTFRETLSRGVSSLFVGVRPSNRVNDSRDRVLALDRLSLEVRQGDVVGILGPNGAGKSTLLKILAKVTEPSDGRAVVKGRVGSLLEVGTGFHPELTGHENIYLYGAILGMNRREISAKFDEIVEFAELQKFIHTPVKRYSSGMYMRLAFAVAAHLDTEILLVDEVLAVGDVAFQKKCLGKIRRVSDSGRTVLFVSHNMDMVRRLCLRGIVLRNGGLRFDGTAVDAIDHYLRGSRRRATDVIRFDKPRWGDIEAYIRKLQFEDTSGAPQRSFPVGRAWQVRVFFVTARSFNRLFVTCGLLDKTGVVIRSTWSVPRDYGPGEHQVVLREDVLKLTPGEYPLYLGLDMGKGQRIQLIENAATLHVSEATDDIDERVLNYKWGILVNQMKTIFPE